MKKTACLMAALAITLSACTSGGEESAETPTTVRVLTHDSFEMSEELIAQFEKESGYTLVTTSPGDGATILNQLVLSKDSPQIDAVYGIDTYLAGSALAEDVIAEAEGDTEGVLEGRLVPIDRGDVCVNADLEWFANEGVDLPATLEDLARPEYAKLLVIPDPVTSATGFAFLAATTAATSDWTAYWSDLVAGEARIASGWSDAYYTDFSGSEGKGPYPLVVSYSSSPAAEVSDGKARTSVIESTCTRMTEYAGTVAGSANPEGAQAFIDFMLSADVQKAMPEAMYMYPIDGSIELPEAWATYAPLATDPIEVDPVTVAENRESWLTEITSIIE